MILGLDISTSKIGIAVLDNDENILHCEVLKYTSTMWKGSEHEHRVEDFVRHLRAIKKKYKIKRIIVEKPFISFKGGGGQALTVAILQSFNGMSRYAIYSVFRMIPELIPPVSARKKVGIKSVRHKGRKKLSTIQKKKPIIDFIFEYYKNTSTPFEYELTHAGNAVPGTDDRADSIVLALSALRT